jgi:CHAD domain-containing protein
VTAIQAAGAQNSGVILPLPTFRLMGGESLGAGLKRLGVSEIDSAITGFYDGEDAFREAVHLARRSMKRVRALLRLVRSEIGDRPYHFENRWMRDTAGLIGGARSAAVMVDSIEGLAGTYGTVLADGTFEETYERLVIRRDRMEQRVMEDPELLQTVVTNLERARRRFDSWPVGDEAREMYGVGIRDRYESIGPGLTGTYRRGRRDMVLAYRSPSAAHFHSWRKRVKYLKHQLEILTPLWPEVMIGMALTLDRIGELLGADHDLAELLHLVSDRPDLCPNPVERSLMSALAQQRRSDLQTAARILGRRIFVEHPGSLDRRFEALWESTQMASSVTLTSLTA